LTSDRRKKRGKRKGSRKQSTSHRKNENTRTANTSLRKTAKAKLELLARVLKLDMDTPGDQEKLRRAVLGIVAGRRMRKAKRTRLKLNGTPPQRG
jgi:hypothetical protein